MSARYALALVALILAGCQAPPVPSGSADPLPVPRTTAAGWTPADWNATCANHDDWNLPGPPFRIFGNTYYVGTCGISAILVTGDEGHVVIDGGTAAAGPLIADNIARLGFAITDVKLLLLTHEHYDHAGGLAFLQQASGARMLASGASVRSLESGRAEEADPQAAILDPFAPVRVDGTVRDGETVRLGNLAVTATATPGHSPGAASWSWRSCDGDRCRDIAYLDSLSAVSADGYRFTDHPALVATFRTSLDKAAALACDIVLTPHPSASDMPARIAGPTGLVDPAGCRTYAAKMRARLDGRLALEAQGT